MELIRRIKKDATPIELNRLAPVNFSLSSDFVSTRFYFDLE